MLEDLEAAFHQKALEIYATAKSECRYNATRFLQKIRKDGGSGLQKHGFGHIPAVINLHKVFSNCWIMVA
jgi:hypothetical protein